MRHLLILMIAMLVSSCSWKPTPEYRAFYAHLGDNFDYELPLEGSVYSITFFVDAPHLDYTRFERLIHTIARHPNGSNSHDVGHAWIGLKGIVDGKSVYIEGGHSGELGIAQARYFDGIMNYLDYGEANPTIEQQRFPQHQETNPVKYLWTTQHDGFFQKGSGGHIPTFAVNVNLSQDQFERIFRFIQPENYNYNEYSLMHHQCCTLVVQIAALIDIHLECDVSIRIAPVIKFGGRTIRLWKDSQFAVFTFGSPDILERSLMKLCYSNE